MGSFNHFAQIGNAIEGRGQELLNAYQAFWQSAAAQLAPVDEGDLQNSVGPAPGDVDDSRKVVAGMDYAIHQEYGTMDMPAQPFMRPARNALVDAWKRDLKKVFGE